MKASTGLILGLLMFGGAAMAVLPWRHAAQSRAFPLLLGVPALAVAVVACAWLLAPRAVTLSPGAVRVERHLLAVVIPVASIRAVELLPPGPLRGALRTLGCSGLFGHYGHFWSRQLGAFRMYSTTTRRLVLLDTDRGRVVISPEPAEDFVAAVRALRPAPP